MPIRRAFSLSVLFLLGLLAVPPPLQAQTPSDSLTLSRESVEALHDAIATLDETISTFSAEIERVRDGEAVEGALSGNRRELAEVLFLFLVLSLVFESAMSVIFDWRVFIRHFEGRGVKTPLIVGVAFLVFWNYELDIVADILRALDVETTAKSLPGQFLTALLIAGGSGGIFRIFSRLGIRSPEERDRKAREERAALNESEEEASDPA